MNKKSTSKSAFFNLRVLLAFVFCLVGIFVALLGMGAFSSVFAQARGAKNNHSQTPQDAPGTQTPEVVRMVGPAFVKNLRDLAYVPPTPYSEERRLTRHPFPQTGVQEPDYPSFQAVLNGVFQAIPSMPPPLLTFDGINFATSGCGCYPPDTNGDVGPNHYVATVNTGFRVYDKLGNPAGPFTTYNSFFAPLTGTPCQNLNRGDPFAFYDQIADRWIVSDFAFASFPGANFYECIGVSQTPNPTGAYSLYALLVDATNLDDYPKLALWPNPAPGGAYHLTVNLFLNGSTFSGVKAFALDRGSMLGGGPANAISFLVPPAGLGDAYSLQPAGYRTGTAPPATRDEMLLAVDSPAAGGVVQTAVKGWLYHVDFVTPANSTLGLGANHSPNALITVNSFVDAFTTTYLMVPQQGTSQKLDTLGDKIMTPMVYQNIGGTESLWADQTIILNYPNGPTAVRWYQFNVTGGTFPATPAQQQDWTNGNDGLWRWMPSIAADVNGNVAIGYSTSSPNIFAGIRYAGRLAGDPPNDLGQGEAVLINGNGNQTGSAGRWGDYSMTTMDTDGTTFWHTNEYYPASAGVNWFTRVGKFNFQGGASPTPTATPAQCSWSAGPNLPTVLVRAVGVYFPDGNFYTMGGRTADTAGSDFQHVLKYNPGTNAWTQMGVTLPDNQMNNMACGVLTVGGTPYIYCVGGSAAGQTTAAARVFFYNPATDTATTLAAGDNWPGNAAGTILPGGFAATGNKLWDPLESTCRHASLSIL